MKLKPNSVEDLWPAAPLHSLRNQIYRFLHSIDRPVALRRWRQVVRPSVDLRETDDRFEVRVELPGLKREEIELSLANGSLVISGERREEVKVEQGRGKAHRAECFHGRFERKIPLPGEVSEASVTARYRDGVLEVMLPNALSAKQRSVRIEVG